VLFDLDGTLVDTAPDMVAVLQELQRSYGREPVGYALGRSHVSNGSIALLRLAFPELDPQFGGALHLEFLDRYGARVCEASSLFPGLGILLDDLDAADRRWGVVTNKPARLAEPLLRGLQLADRSACIVSGDTLTLRKPDPAPLLHACELGGMTPATTMYIGDAARDIEAGRNAGMATVAAAYGYVTDDDDPARWGADCVAADSDELARIVRKAVNLGER